jgi:DNA-binding CsgD family transcriptional regulator
MQPGVIAPNHHVANAESNSPGIPAPIEPDKRLEARNPGDPATRPDGTFAPDDLARATIEARAILEAAANAAAEAAEQALAVAVALDQALAQLEEHDPHEVSVALASNADSVPRTPLGELSPREREVLALVARGYSNKDIANALYVSPNTVKTHVASLLHKLDAETRAQLAAIATRQDQHRQPPGRHAGIESDPG